MKFNAYADRNSIMGMSILSCGHIFAQKGRRIRRPNGRNSWLLLYIAKETETFFLDAKVEAPAGSFLFYKPFEHQDHVYLGDKTAEFYYVHFTLEEASYPFDLKTSTVYTIKPSATVCNLFEEIINEVQLKQPCYEEICIFKLLELIGLLKRKLISQNVPHREYGNKIAFVIQLMNRECDVNRSLEEFAEMCQMSKFHFIRVFEEITGSTPIAYRNRIRMERAREMLEYTSTPVNEIAGSLGYESAAYFCDAFKRENGVSPTQYRREKWNDTATASAPSPV